MTFVTRPLRPQDVGRWAELLGAVVADEGAGERARVPRGEGELREAFDDPHRDYERGSVAIFDDVTLVAYGVLNMHNAGDPLRNVRHEGAVHPAYTGRGLGAQVLDWAEHAAVLLNGERPFTLTSGCDLANSPAAALHTAHGFRQTRRFYSMVRDLGRPIARVSLAPGLRIERFASELSQDALVIRNESFRDHWGSSPVSQQAWAHRVAAGSFRPELSYLVYDGAEPLGLLLGAEPEVGDAAFGARELVITLVGTRAAGRRRGIATALVNRAMSDARTAGYGSAALGVDAESPTGAVRVYERAGFTVGSTRTVYAKSLSG